MTAATTLSGGANTDSVATDFIAGDTIVVNGTTINFVASGATGNDLNITDTVGNVISKINSITGGTSTISGGAITLHTGTASDLTVSGSGLAKLGLSAATTARTAGAPAALAAKR